MDMVNFFKDMDGEAEYTKHGVLVTLLTPNNNTWKHTFPDEQSFLAYKFDKEDFVLTFLLEKANGVPNIPCVEELTEDAVWLAKEIDDLQIEYKQRKREENNYASIKSI